MKEALAERATNPRLVEKTEKSALFSALFSDDPTLFSDPSFLFSDDPTLFCQDSARFCDPSFLFSDDPTLFCPGFFPSTLLFPVRHLTPLVVRDV